MGTNSQFKYGPVFFKNHERVVSYYIEVAFRDNQNMIQISLNLQRIILSHLTAHQMVQNIFSISTSELQSCFTNTL